MIRVRDEIFVHMERMSPAERKVARTVLDDYPGLGLASANSLARAAGTSAPTVLRMVSRLGLGGYAEFQQLLRAEITHDLNSPVRRAEERRHDESRHGNLGSLTALRGGLVDRLTETVSDAEFASAADLLANRPSSVLISGGYFSRSVAEIMARQLDQIIPNVEFLADPLGYDIGKFHAANRRSVVVLFDVRRYQRAGQRIAALARKQRASLIVITDQGLSPCVEDATVVLPAPVDGIPFDSFAALMVLAEALVEAVFLRTGVRGVERMQLFEDRSHIPRAAQAGPHHEEDS